MKRVMVLLMLGLMPAIGCREEPVQPLSEYESADLTAAAWDFKVHPNAEFDAELTDLYRKAHFVMNPAAESAPPMAVYTTDNSLEEVAQWYASLYGYARLAENEVNDFSSVAPRAYLTRGDLGEATRAIVPLLEKLELPADVSAVEGEYRGAHISKKDGMPRVTLQRPFYDAPRGTVVDRTFILLVRE